MIVQSYSTGTDSDLPQSVIDFLLLHEKICVPLLERIQKREVPFFALLENGRIEGVFSYSSGRQILHCLPFVESKPKVYFSCLLKFFSMIGTDNLFSVIGRASGTDLFVDVLKSSYGKVPSIWHSYDFMELPEVLPERKLSSACVENSMFSVRSCGLEYLDLLLPVQELYEKEEVLSGGQQYNPAVTRFLLKKSLKENRVFALFNGDKIISKATLTAVGKKYVQIGGVFSEKSFRRQGCSYLLMRNLLAYLMDKNQIPVLFVKPENAAARNLYKKCGFSVFDKFKICYY